MHQGGDACSDWLAATKRLVRCRYKQCSRGSISNYFPGNNTSTSPSPAWFALFFLLFTPASNFSFPWQLCALCSHNAFYCLMYGLLLLTRFDTISLSTASKRHTVLFLVCFSLFSHTMIYISHWTDNSRKKKWNVIFFDAINMSYM